MGCRSLSRELQFRDKSRAEPERLLYPEADVLEGVLGKHIIDQRR